MYASRHPVASALEAQPPSAALAVRLDSLGLADLDELAVLEVVAAWERVAAWVAARQAIAVAELAPVRRARPSRASPTRSPAARHHATRW